MSHCLAVTVHKIGHLSRCDLTGPRLEGSHRKPFDRVHHLGQQKNAFVERLVIENIAEDRILALQEQKVGLVYRVCILIYCKNLCPEEPC